MRLVDQPREDGEVERGLLHSARSQQLDRLDDQELGQAVGRLAVSAHERQGDRGPAVARCEMEEPSCSTFLVAADHDEAVAVVFLAQRVE